MIAKVTNVGRNNKILNISLVYSLSKNQDVLSFQLKKLKENATSSPPVKQPKYSKI